MESYYKLDFQDFSVINFKSGFQVQEAWSKAKKFQCSFEHHVFWIEEWQIPVSVELLYHFCPLIQVFMISYPEYCTSMTAGFLHHSHPCPTYFFFMACSDISPASSASLFPYFLITNSVVFQSVTACAMLPTKLNICSFHYILSAWNTLVFLLLPFPSRFIIQESYSDYADQIDHNMYAVNYKICML